VCVCVVAGTTSGELMMVDDIEKMVLWRTHRLNTTWAIPFMSRIFSVTRTGNIETFSVCGRNRQEVDVRGMLRDVRRITSHRMDAFLGVWLNDGRVFFINRMLEVFQVEIPPPKLSDEPAAAEDEEPVEDMIIDMREQLTGPLVLCLKKQTSVCFLLVTETGKALHHQTVKYSCIHKWLCPFLTAMGNYEMVIEHERCVEAISIQFEGAEVILKQLWKKALPDMFPAVHDQVIVAGKKFVLVCLNSGLKVCRMDNGKMVGEFPGISIR